MTATNAIEVMLDLRGFAERLNGPAEFLALWEELTPALVGRSLTAGRTHKWEYPKKGELRLTVISVPPECSVISAETPFAIHSVLEQPVVLHACSVCLADNKRVYGPFLCAQCSWENKKTRLCDKHVVILDGGMQTFCPNHHPRARSGEPATFWCPGRLCRLEQAWSEKDRVRRPNDPDIWYCPDCYDTEYPRCSVTGCKNTGYIRCEHVDPGTLEACGRRICDPHVQNWQVYGPHKMGLAHCEQHRNVKSLSDQQMIFQIVAGTANRQLRLEARGRSRRQAGSLYLPTVNSIRHILLHARQRPYDIRVIYPWFTALGQLSGKPAPLQHAMAQLIRDRDMFWKEELRRAQEKGQVGLQYFERVKAEYRAMGLDQVADALRFSDYREPRSTSDKLLFVYLEENLRGLFIGAGGKNIKQVQERVGVKVSFEKGS